MALDPGLPKGHIANFPAGHKREEENRKRTDELAERIEADTENAGSLSTDAMKVENEIAQHFDAGMNLAVSNPNPARHYVWIKAHNIVTASYRSMGFKPVQGNDPEADEYKGQDAAGTSSLRGVGDVLLYWCPIEQYEAREADFNRRAADKLGMVETAWADNANYSPGVQRYGALAHGDPNDPLLRRTVFRGNAGQIERVSDALKQGRGLPTGVQVRDS